MATIVTESPPRSAPASAADGDQVVTLWGIGWDGYEAICRVLEDRPRPRKFYLDGDLDLMVTSSIHEWRTERLGVLVREVVVGLDIPCVPTRGTTFRRRDLEAGVEPDDSFYLAHHEAVAAKEAIERIDLDVDPPPDLVIEVVHTHPAKKAIEIYRRLGVPEVWVGDVDGVRILILGPDGRYADSPTGRAFPFLAAAEVHEWAAKPGYPSATRWTQDIRRWVRDALAPRAAGLGG